MDCFIAANITKSGRVAATLAHTICMFHWPLSPRDLRPAVPFSHNYCSSPPRFWQFSGGVLEGVGIGPWTQNDFGDGMNKLDKYLALEIVTQMHACNFILTHTHTLSTYVSQ